MKDATETDLKRSISLNEARAEWSGLAVVFGLFVEVVFAFVYRDHRSNIEYWTPVISDVIVTLGVAGEILFARKASASQEKLRLLADKEIAELNEKTAEALKQTAEARERAADALLELERLKAPRALSELQANAVVAKLAPFRGRKTIVIASPSTYEGALFADQINRILNEASLESTRLDRWLPTRGSITAQDVHVTFNEEDSASEELVFAIVEAFVSVGIKADSSAASPDWWPAIKGHALVVVGDKT